MTGTHPSALIPRSIPGVPTSLIGREDDVRQLSHTLMAGSTRLLTITGPGGIGKTRLAIHVATQLADAFTDGPVVVSLAAITDRDLVFPTILQHLGMSDDTATSPVEQVTAALQGRRILLVLDNLEHLLACGPDLGTIVAACDGVRILCTSQAPLGLRSERIYPLQSLELPSETASPDEIYAANAVALFVERSQSVNSRLVTDERNAATIADLCRHLDGLPLAIELAASRSGILNPKAMLARLDQRFTVLTSHHRDVPERLRTLSNAIGWSYDLLDPAEQRAFRWLSVFADGIPLEAAEALPAEDGDDAPALDLLAQLVDRSLIRTVMTPDESPRYLMLESLRDYGQEQLRHAGEEEIARAWHAVWFANLGEAVGARVRQDAEAVTILGTEWGNIRQALAWFLDRGDATPALVLCGSLWRFWKMRGIPTEGRAWTKRALELSPGVHTPERAIALKAAGALATAQGDFAEAEQMLREALAITESRQDLTEMAHVLSNLGSLAHDQRDYPGALAWHQRAVEAARASGDLDSQATALGNLGGVHYFLGNYVDSRTFTEEAITIARQRSDRQGEALLLGNLGAQLLEIGELVSARNALERAQELSRAIGDRFNTAAHLMNLGDTYYLMGDMETPLPLLAEAIDIMGQAGYPGPVAIAQVGLARIVLARGDIPGSLAIMHDALNGLNHAEDWATSAEAAELLAGAAIALDRFDDARTLLHDAAILHDHLASPVRPSLAKATEAARQRVRDAFGPDALPPPTAEDLARPPLEIVANAIRIASNLHLRTQQTAMPERAVPPVNIVASSIGTTVDHGLSERELDVLRLLANGKSTREIADDLFIAPRTAATHINNIIGKLGVSSRTAAVALAMRHGIV